MPRKKIARDNSIKSHDHRNSPTQFGKNGQRKDLGPDKFFLHFNDNNYDEANKK